MLERQLCKPFSPFDDVIKFAHAAQVPIKPSFQHGVRSSFTAQIAFGGRVYTAQAPYKNAARDLCAILIMSRTDGLVEKLNAHIGEVKCKFGVGWAELNVSYSNQFQFDCEKFTE
jgi:hypothetical protein